MRCENVADVIGAAVNLARRISCRISAVRDCSRNLLVSQLPELWIPCTASEIQGAREANEGGSRAKVKLLGEAGVLGKFGRFCRFLQALWLVYGGFWQETNGV
ncbi:MAG: hypothetical protein RIT02_1383 [Planctomycetota bacterium]